MADCPGAQTGWRTSASRSDLASYSGPAPFTAAVGCREPGVPESSGPLVLVDEPAQHIDTDAIGFERGVEAGHELGTRSRINSFTWVVRSPSTMVRLRVAGSPTHGSGGRSRRPATPGDARAQ